MIDRLNAALEGRYRIERELGEGGMATVYLAEDLRHDRSVALKVLKPELAAVVGAERFLAEIKTTAQLQHPHILPLHDSGEADSFLFYVMPYVEGESLREKLEREQQLPVEDALAITEKVAAALQYAHEQGVVHRDIKPANILMSRGEPVVADFGIALAVSQAGGGRITETGLSLGTPHYMSPEQAAGERTLDKRSDVYALGCVTYEMLTGQPPFGGPNAQAVLGRILTGEPDPVTEHRKAVPPNVEAAVHKSLERLPADRFESAQAYAAALRNPAFGADRQTGARTAGALDAGGPGRRALLIGLLLAVLASVFLVGWWTASPAPEGVMKQRVDLWRSAVPVRGEFYVALAAAIAPDGSAITYTDFLDGRLQLFRKPREEVLASPVAGTEGGAAPAYSPDGEWLVFITTEFELRKVRSGGGGSVVLAEDVSALAAPHWVNEHIYYVSRGFDLARVGENGGDPELVLSLGDRMGQIAASVYALPGGRGVLFTGCAGNCNQGNVYLYDMATDSISLLFEDAHGAWYLPTGHVAYASLAGGLFAAPFDVDELRVTGGAVAVIPDVAPYGFVYSEQGTVVYGVADVTGVENELAWVTLDGLAAPIDPDWRGRFAYPDISPDGTRLAVSIASGGDEQIWVKRLDRGPEQKLTAEGNVAFRPEWSPDGGFITYVVGSDDLSRDLYVRRSDGSSDAELLLDLPVAGIWEAEYSKDGRWLLYRTDQGTTGDLYALSLETGDTVTLLNSEHDERQAALSPDGRWLAYISDRSGRYEVYVRPFPNTGEGRTVISSDGGSEPVWSPDGTRLFYREDGMMKGVEILSGPSLETGRTSELFEVDAFASAFNRRQYDIHPDGDRFVMIRLGEQGGLTLVYGENWFEELRERLND
ncbi:MAG: protein kinase [Longimicrobiales bacterium]|nr:protein kinase [Longimicrobiales bacterium]